MKIKEAAIIAAKFAAAALLGVFIWAEGMCLSAWLYPAATVPIKYVGTVAVDTKVFGDRTAVICKTADELKNLGIVNGLELIDFSKYNVCISKEYPIFSVTQLREAKFPFRYIDEVMLDFNYSSRMGVSHIYEMPKLDYTITFE